MRRMRSVLDMRFGPLLAAGMPLVDDGLVSPPPVPTTRRTTTSATTTSTAARRLWNEQERDNYDDHDDEQQEQETIQTRTTRSGVDIIRNDTRATNKDTTTTTTSSYNHIVDSPHSMLSPDDTAWLVAQIGQLKIEQTHDHDFVDDTQQHTNNTVNGHGAIVKQQEHVNSNKRDEDDKVDGDGDDEQVDVFGIPIPSSSPCSSCTSLPIATWSSNSRWSAIGGSAAGGVGGMHQSNQVVMKQYYSDGYDDVDVDNEFDEAGDARRRRQEEERKERSSSSKGDDVCSADDEDEDEDGVDVEVEAEVEAGFVEAASVAQLMGMMADPSCSVVLADSPSRLDLSALLC